MPRITLKKLIGWSLYIGALKSLLSSRFEVQQRVFRAFEVVGSLSTWCLRGQRSQLYLAGFGWDWSLQQT